MIQNKKKKKSFKKMKIQIYKLKSITYLLIIKYYLEENLVIYKQQIQKALIKKKLLQQTLQKGNKTGLKKNSKKNKIFKQSYKIKNKKIVHLSQK